MIRRLLATTYCREFRATTFRIRAKSAAAPLCGVVMTLFCVGVATGAGPIGFASENGGTTGGGDAPTVVARTASQFRTFAEGSDPLNILVEGSLDIGGVRVKSNKTIFGVGDSAELIGSLQLRDVNNIIIRNLSLSNPDIDGEGDVITLRGTTNVWIDHNTITDADDGLLDIVRASDFVTVSWNHFHYSDAYAATQNTNHRFAMLIGNSDGATEDTGKLRVTMHDNYFGKHVIERMPRVRYGDVHLFNSYVNSPGNNYVVRAAIESEVLFENNHLENVEDVFDFSQNGQIEANGNLFTQVQGSTIANDDVFTPPYDYRLRDVLEVKHTVQARAGATLILPGDYSEDGTVDAADYTVWRDHLGSESGALANDIDGNVIRGEQYVSWVSRFGDGAGSNVARSFAIPEPGSLSLGVMLLALLQSSRRRRRTD